MIGMTFVLCSVCADSLACLCRYVACMNPTAGSFVVNPRLQRLFMTLAVEFPGQESLMKIYGTFVTGHLKKFSADVQVIHCPATCLMSHAKLQAKPTCLACTQATAACSQTLPYAVKATLATT